MSTQPGSFEFWDAVGFIAGLWMFFKGFKIYREYRVLEDTPEIPIRSIPMGLVHVHGKATGEQPIPSPISHTPCFFYKVDIERWEHHGKGSSWRAYKTDIDGSKFYLDDGSGKVLVDAHGAEYDLEKSCQCETGKMMTAGATEDELRRYVSKVQVARVFSFVGKGLASVGHLSDPHKEEMRAKLADAFQQPALSPDFMKKMMAIQMPMMERRFREMGPQSDPQKEKVRLAALEAMKYPPGSPEFMEHAHQVMDAEHHPEHAQQFDQFMSAAQGSPPALDSMISPASGRYRFTEYCIVPDHSYDVTATCAENPQAQGEHDRNMLMKGTNEPTFLISFRTEKGIESKLRWRAAGYVFGGAALAVACLAIFLAKYGWLF
ncbi:MAG TPA: hypothetical protein VG028_12465 [Terriglobia bacterium]|nr:hypothetical protein [Terriglobia bacterium]